MIFNSPMRVILEAKKKNQVDPDENTDDYTEEVEDNEDTQNEPSTEETPDEDASSDDQSDENDTSDTDPDEVESGDDYTAETDGEPVDGEDTSTETDDDTSTDNTGEDFTSEVDSGDGTSDSTDDTSTDSTGETPEETPEGGAEKRNLSLLHEDFVNLYNNTKGIIQKLNSYDNSSTIMNTVCVQVVRNLTKVKTLIWDHIMYDFDKSNYVSNLHKYNYFIEALVINITMLKKTRLFVSDLENK